MRRNKNIQTDISFIALVVLMFVYFIFLIYQEEYLMDNFLIASVVFIIVLITYFTNLTTGLIINTTLILTYITYIIIQSLTKGAVIRPYVYFWILMSPALTTVWNGQPEVGRRAARALLDRIDGVKDQSGALELIRPELHIRQSTSPVKDRS